MADLNSTIVRGDLRVTGDIKGTAINTRAKVFSINRDVEDDIPLAELEGIKNGDIIHYQQYEDCGIATFIEPNQLQVRIPDCGVYFYNITNIDYEFDSMTDVAPTILYRHYLVLNRAGGAPYCFEVITSSSQLITLNGSTQIAIRSQTLVSYRSTSSGTNIIPWLTFSRPGSDTDIYTIFIWSYDGSNASFTPISGVTGLTDTVTKI